MVQTPLGDCFMKCGNETFDLLERLGETQALFKKLSELLGACEARLFVSAAAAAVRPKPAA
jgi:hypothetical protein